MNNTSSDQDTTLHNTDLCVMCGMCLPHCPTYLTTQSESESPRGRISLIKALIEHRIDAETDLTHHIDSCLGCMACQDMCPSHVPYDEIITSAKAITLGKRSHHLIEKLLSGLMARRRLSTDVIRVAKQIGLGKLALNLGRLTDSQRLTNAGFIINQARPHRFNRSYPCHKPQAPQVILFTGCIGTSLDTDALISTIQLINKLGYDILVPGELTCCGALHKHIGDTSRSDQLRAVNRSIFSSFAADRILFTSNGCGSHLKKQFPDLPLQDIITFLLEQLRETPLKPRSLDKRVMIHESCSTQFKLHAGGLCKQLLQQIPDIRLVEFKTGHICCGAGGTHQLTHPNMAAQLAGFKIAEIKQSEPDLIVSDNFSCAMHLRQSLYKEAPDLEVIHPVTLLARMIS